MSSAQWVWSPKRGTDGANRHNPPCSSISSSSRSASPGDRDASRVESRSSTGFEHQCPGIVRFEHGFTRPTARSPDWPQHGVRHAGKPSTPGPHPAHQEVRRAREIADWVIPVTTKTRLGRRATRLRMARHRSARSRASDQLIPDPIPENERHRRRHRPRDPRFPRQSHHRSRRRPESGVSGRAAVPSGASTGSKEAIELRDGDAGALPRQGRHRAVGERQHRDLRGDPRPDASEQGFHRPHADRARRHREQGPPRRQRAPRRLVRGGEGRRRTRRRCRSTAIWAAPGQMQLPVPMMNVINGGAHANNKIDLQEFMRWCRSARRRSARRCAYGAEVFHTLKKLIHARGMPHHRRRRGRLRPRPAVQRGGAAAPGRGDRQGRATAGQHRYRARAAMDAPRASSEGRRLYRLEVEDRTLTSRRCRRARHLVRQVSDRQHRGRHVRARLGRAGKALTDRLGRGTSRSSATTSSSPTRRSSQGSRRASPTRSSSRSTRSAPLTGDLRRRHDGHARGYTAVISHRSARPRTASSPTSRWHQRRADQDRLARAATASPSTTSSCASRRISAGRDAFFNILVPTNGTLRILRHPARPSRPLQIPDVAWSRAAWLQVKPTASCGAA